MMKHLPYRKRYTVNIDNTLSLIISYKEYLNIKYKI